MPASGSDRPLPDIQAFWDYNDPLGTRSRLEAARPQAEASMDRQYHAELLTQIARTHSLMGEFEQAHAILDRVDSMTHDHMPRARVRSLLERGRSYNSAGKPERAGPLFIEAWEVSRANGIDGLAVDAAHMVAIVEPPERALEWNQRALNLANTSSDPDARRWRGSLCNNLGWTHHEKAEYETALAYFESALKHRIEQGKPADVRIARWCVARCLRSLGRVEDALSIQRDLEREIEASGASADGYVPEEIAECLHALDRSDEAKPYFRRAHELLSQEVWLAENEPDRLTRLLRLGGQAP